MNESTNPVASQVLIPGAECSGTLGKLADALAKAQAAMKNARKDCDNPFFKSRYADLASVWEAARGPLSANGLAVLQPVTADGAQVTVCTVLVHVSGEYLVSALTVTAKESSPQGVGSAITYARRYGLAAMVGIAPEDEDDDGEAAEGRAAQSKKTEKKSAPNPTPAAALDKKKAEGTAKPPTASSPAPAGGAAVPSLDPSIGERFLAWVKDQLKQEGDLGGVATRINGELVKLPENVREKCRADALRLFTDERTRRSHAA